MRIFHFCNDTFGAAFAERSQAFAGAHRMPVVLVYSVRKKGSRLNLSAPLRDAVERMRNPYLRRWYVRDVNAREFRDAIAPDDRGIVTGFGQIFKRETIERFASLVNLHPSVLPYYRGPVPTRWCLERGETRTGFTLHELTPRIDDGPVLYQELVEIASGDTAASLARRIAEAAVPAFERYLESVASGEMFPVRALRADDVYWNPIGYRSHT